MRILTQNAKMKKSSQNGIEIYNFGIPAFLSQTGIKTCPNAGRCATGCYARSGTYRFGNVVNAYEERLKLTQSPDFTKLVHNEVMYHNEKAEINGRRCIIRIHDSGDFYSKEYANSWFLIMRQNPTVLFYAYTKMVQMFKETLHNDTPHNFTLIYSMGGLQDSQIDTNTDRHSKVFENETSLIEAGYSDASQDDMVAATGLNTRIGLVYHGSKKYTNTKWGVSK